MEKRITSQQGATGSRNLAEMRQWRTRQGAWTCDDHYLAAVNRKWRSIGRQAALPASLRDAENHN